MRNTTLFLFLLSFCHGTVQAQHWAPIGAKWTYEVGYAFSGTRHYNEWISTGDTLISGRSCRIIGRNGQAVTTDASDKLITYEDSNIVYWYHANQFTVLYDFNKSKGDTWTITSDTCNMLVTVDSTGIDTINGIPLKALYITCTQGVFSGKVLERIGHLLMPNPDLLTYCQKVAVDINYYRELRCYEDSSLGSHKFVSGIDCDYSNGLAETENPFGLNLYPNPASGTLNIGTTHAFGLAYTLFNNLGQPFGAGFITETEHEISLDHLPAGIYFIEFLSGAQFQRTSFLVIK